MLQVQVMLYILLGLLVLNCIFMFLFWRVLGVIYNSMQTLAQLVVADKVYTVGGITATPNPQSGKMN